ncbi:hypothetical protein PVAP13_6NG110130, partial [Panicum virgatum]
RRAVFTCAASSTADGKTVGPGSSSAWRVAPSSSSPTSSAMVLGLLFFVLANGWRSFASLGMCPLSTSLLWSASRDFASGRRRRRTALPLPFSACWRSIFFQRLRCVL